MLASPFLWIETIISISKSSGRTPLDSNWLIILLIVTERKSLLTLTNLIGTEFLSSFVTFNCSMMENTSSGVQGSNSNKTDYSSDYLRYSR